MFIDLEDGNDVIAVDQIARCTTDSNYNTVITLKDGQVLKQNTFYTAPRIASKAAPFIQAQPGYFKIEIPRDEPYLEELWQLIPIVAWRIIGEFDFAEPVTVQMSDLGVRYAVLTPDGTIYEPGGGTPYSSRTDFLRALKAKVA